MSWDAACRPSLTSFFDFLSFGIYWLLFSVEHSIRKLAVAGMSSVNRVDYAVIGLVCAAHGAGRALRDALQPQRGGIFSRWEPRSLAGGGTELLHVGFQRVDIYRGGGCCVPCGDCCHRTVYRQRSEFPAGIFCFRRALAAEPDHDGDGVSVRPLQPDHSSDILVDHDPVSAFYQRQHAVRAQPVRFVGVRFSGNVDHRRRGRHHHFLLCDWAGCGRWWSRIFCKPPS